MDNPVGQGFAEAVAATDGAKPDNIVLAARNAADRPLLFKHFLKLAVGLHADSHIVQIQKPGLDLDPVARQADQTLDEILTIDRMAEHHHIAALRVTRQNAARNRADRKGAGIFRIAIGHLVDEQKVADQQRVFHRFRRDPEGLEKHRAEHPGDQQGIDDRLDEFDDAAFGLRCLACHLPCPECFGAT